MPGLQETKIVVHPVPAMLATQQLLQFRYVVLDLLAQIVDTLPQ